MEYAYYAPEPNRTERIEDGAALQFTVRASWLGERCLSLYLGH